MRLELSLFPHLWFWSSNMFLLKQKLSVEIADINSIQINLQTHKRGISLSQEQKEQNQEHSLKKRQLAKMQKLHRPLLSPLRCHRRGTSGDRGPWQKGRLHENKLCRDPGWKCTHTMSRATRDGPARTGCRFQHQARWEMQESIGQVQPAPAAPPPWASRLQRLLQTNRSFHFAQLGFEHPNHWIQGCTDTSHTLQGKIALPVPSNHCLSAR